MSGLGEDVGSRVQEVTGLVALEENCNIHLTKDQIDKGAFTIGANFPSGLFKTLRTDQECWKTPDFGGMKGFRNLVQPICTHPLIL